MPSDEVSQRVIYALRYPRGRYLADRTSQLSGVPRSTIYDWRREGVYVPDFDHSDPIAWSYRDLVFLRLLAWLRQGGMERRTAATSVAKVKSHISRGNEVRYLRANSQTLLLDDEAMNRFSGVNVLPFENLSGLLSTFDLHEPIEELRRRGQQRVWAPDLVTPSKHTFISPWVMAGDPCVERTRIPTSAIYALRSERGLARDEIVALYPGLTKDAAEDAFRLEQRLRAHGFPEPLAA